MKGRAAFPGSIDIGEFTENLELINVLNYYTAAYLRENPHRSFASLEDMQIIKPEDEADVGVYLPSPDQGLLDSAFEKATLEITISEALFRCVAYFLAQNDNIAANTIPGTLRIALPVNHNNLHWTGIIVTIPSFGEFVERVKNETPVEALSALNNSHHPLNDGIKIVQQFLAFKTDYTAEEQKAIEEAINAEKAKMKGKDPVLANISSYSAIAEEKIFEKLGFLRRTPDLEKAKQLFGQFPPFGIDHYDSMNNEHYSNRIRNGLRTLKNLVNSVKCSDQHGNTCGDHTIVNLFMKALYGYVPLLNAGKNITTSKDLRAFTYAIPFNPYDDINFDHLDPDNVDPEFKPEETLLNQAGKLMNEIKKPRDKIISDRFSLLDSLGKELIDELNKLSKIGANTASYIINEVTHALRQGNNIDGKQLEEIIQKSPDYAASQQKMIMTCMEKILGHFKGEFDTRGSIREEDRIIYMNFACVIAIDTCAQWLHDELRKDKDALLAQTKHDLGLPEETTMAEIPQTRKSSLTPRRILAASLLFLLGAASVTASLFFPPLLIVGAFIGALAFISAIGTAITPWVKNRWSLRSSGSNPASALSDKPFSSYISNLSGILDTNTDKATPPAEKVEVNAPPEAESDAENTTPRLPAAPPRP